jgi:beta-phosphoglucomutase
MTKIDAVIFDMDGVLIDARDWHYEALNNALALFGMSISRDTHLSTFDGLPTRKKLEMLSRSRGLPKGLQSFVNALKQKHTAVKIATFCRPVFQHRYMLSHLQRIGYRLAVCSNSIRATMDSMMSHAALDEYFEVTLSNEDVKHPKPAPDMYVEAMRRLGVAPGSCLIVEDNTNGIEAARAAGAHVLEVASPDDVTWARISKQIGLIEKAAA